jgi:hypothetical protein
MWIRWIRNTESSVYAIYDFQLPGGREGCVGHGADGGVQGPPAVSPPAQQTAAQQ